MTNFRREAQVWQINTSYTDAGPPETTAPLPLCFGATADIGISAHNSREIRQLIRETHCRLKHIHKPLRIVIRIDN